VKTAPSRLLLKLSGEALKGQEGPLSPTSLRYITDEIVSLADTELAIVVGGGNYIRGARSQWLDRVEADTLGMLATVINGLALRAYLEKAGREVVIQSAIATELTDPISPRGARAAMASGAIVIFAGGTGSPLVTTDTAAAFRAAAIGADLLAKGSNVAGVFTEDPDIQKGAQLLQELSFDTFINRRYGVMDIVAVEICREHNLPIVVFDLGESGNLAALAAGRRVGTWIH